MPTLDANMRSVIAGKAPSRGGAWSSRARDGIRLWQRRAGHIHTEFFRAVPCAVSLRQRDTHEQR